MVNLKHLKLGWRFGSIVIVILLVLPFLFRLTDYPDYLLYIVVRMMILGLYAMSFDLLLGYTGIFSFGHAANFGAGAYVLAILATRFGVSDPIIGISLGIVAAVVVSGIVGFLSSRVGPVAIFLVTFASVEVLLLITYSNPLDLTNGENGIAGILRLPILGIINIEPEINFYYFTYAVLFLSYLILRKIVHSPLGDIFQACRENTERTRHTGYNVEQFQIASFVIAGIFSGLAGCLNVLHEGIASPDAFNWHFSGDAVLFTVLGGVGTLVGPILGASIIVFLQELISDIIREWLVFIGACYMILILFLPKGLFPLISRSIRGIEHPES